MLISILMIVFILSALLPNAAMLVTAAVRGLGVTDGKTGAFIARILTLPLWVGAWVGLSARSVDTTKLTDKVKKQGHKLRSLNRTGTEG